MDLSKLHVDTQSIDITVPGSGKKTGLTIEIRSPESDEVKAVQRKWQNKALRAGRNTIDADDVEKQSLDLIVAAVASWKWSGDAKWGGEKPDCTPENVRKVVSSPAGAFIRNQIDQAFGDEAGFFTDSVKT